MPIPLAAIAAGAGVAAKLLGGRKRRPDNRRAIAELRAARPVGYLTPEDYTASERTRGRLAEGVQGQGRLAGYEVSRRARARGLAGSPSEERSQARVNQGVALGVQHAGESSEEQLYNIRTGREHFQQESELAIFGANTNQAVRDAARQDAQQSEFWNSLNEFLPTIMSYLPGATVSSPGGQGGQGGGTGIRGFNPSSGRREQLPF